MSKAKPDIMGSIKEKKGAIIATILVAIVVASAISYIGLRPARADVGPHLIYGYVTYEDGTPVANATVNITDTEDGEWLVNITDINGFYSVNLGNIADWFNHTLLIGYALYQGWGGENTTTIDNTTFGQWLNITIDSPRTNKTIGEPKCGTGYYVTSQTPFNLTAEDAPNGTRLTDVNATYYRIWYNGNWTPQPGNGIGIGGNFSLYTGNFTLNQGEGLYYIEFYSDDTLGNEERIHNQSHFVDETPPPYTPLQFGSPNSTIGGFDAINCTTPIWLNVTDNESLAEWVNFSVWYNPNNPGPFNHLRDVSVRDNGPNDLNDTIGVISVDINQFIYEECFHEVRWTIEDCLGNRNGPFDWDFAVDCSPPIITKEIGKPKQPGIYGNATWVTSRTPIWFNVSDVGCGGGAGVWKFGYEIWWKENCTDPAEPWNTTRYEKVVIIDNGTGDLDPRPGYISNLTYFEDDCCHEIAFWAVDYVGNNNSTKQKHWVDNTPPAIRKDIEKVVALEQAKDGEYVAVREIEGGYFIGWIDNNQTFKAPWSYIDAISVKLFGSGDLIFPTNDTWVELYDENGLLAASNAISLDEPVDGWIQFHFPTRIYVPHNKTLNLTVKSYADMHWYYNSTYPTPGGPYPGGNATVNGVHNNSWDFTFKIEYYPIVLPVYVNVFHEDFEDAWVADSDGDLAPPGWEVIVTDNGTNFGLSCYWSQYDNGMFPGVVQNGTYSAGVWWNYTAQNEWLISPQIHLPKYTADLFFWSYYIRPAIADPNFHNYIKISTDNGSTWTTLADLCHDAEYELGGNIDPSFNAYEVPIAIDISAYAGKTVRIAWHYDWNGTGGTGVRGIWMVDNVTITSTQPSSIYDPSTMYTLYNTTISYDGLHRTWVTSKAIFNLSSWDEWCMGGVGLKDLLYRIWFNDTWHPLDDEDMYCGNYNITYIDGKYWYVAINDTLNFTHIQFHEECKHILQIRSEDLLGNVRIVNQTHYVDNSPPELRVEYPDVHGFYYDNETGKQFVRAGKTFYLNLTDLPEGACAVGWKNFTFYWRYEYTNFTTPYIETHPENGNDHEYPGELYFDGEYWWWRVNVTGEPSINLTFYRECKHTIYYFYNASDWLDNEIVSKVMNETIYVDEGYPELNKTHPPCYKDEPFIYLHPYVWRMEQGMPQRGGVPPPWVYPFPGDWLMGSVWHELYPDYCRDYGFDYWDDTNGDGNITPCDYVSMWDFDYDVYRMYHVENVTITLEIYNETLNETKYIEFISAPAGNWSNDFDWVMHTETGVFGSHWHEIYPTFCTIYNMTDSNDPLERGTNITLNNTATGQETNWTIMNATLDLVFDPVPFIQKCARINLTAKDMPYMLELVDQFQTEGDELDTLQNESATTPMPWDAQTFTPNNPYLNATYLYLKWINDVNVTVYIHDATFAIIGMATVPLIGTGEDWIKFEFNPGLPVTPGGTYYIEAYADPASEASWYFANITLSTYPGGHAWISGVERQDLDWKFQIVSYMLNPCASGIEGIYYGYEFEGVFHPQSMSDNTSIYGKVVNISNYYDDYEIATNFSGHYLWYVYNESIGVHFHEECIHWLYYWTKDNVCHHTNVTMQVYHVDAYNPIVTKKYPDHGYYTPVTIEVNPTFDNMSGDYEGEFHVRNDWSWNWPYDGWDQYYGGDDYVNKSQDIWFKITNNDLNKDLILTLHIEEIVGDEGITFVNHGGDVNFFNDTIVVPAMSYKYYYVRVYDNLPFLRWGVWHWWVEIDNVTQYLRAGAKINLSAYDPGNCASGVENIYWRYVWNNTMYPEALYPGVVNGSTLSDEPEIANYLWYIYNDTTDIIFDEECKHDLYYFAKDRSCHNSTVHHQVYYVDASPPIVEKILPSHGAIGDATVSLEEGFGVPFGNGWAVVNGSNSYWTIYTNEPYFDYHYTRQKNIDYYGRYVAFAWKDGGAPSSPDAWLISPQITIPEDGNLSFWYKTNYPSTYSNSKAGFEVCINNGSYQTNTGAFVEVWNTTPFVDNNYRKVEIDLHQYAGQPVYIGFHCNYLESDYPYYSGLLIDDVWVGSIHRIATPLDDDVEDSLAWTIDDLTVDGSFWQSVGRIPVYNTTPPAPSMWCGNLSLGNGEYGFGKYACNWNDTLMLKNPINLSDANCSDDVWLDFWWWLNSECCDDTFYVEISNDSINWTTLTSFSGDFGGWQHGFMGVPLNISAYKGNATVWIRFRFKSDDYSTNDNGVFLDNVSIYNSTHFFLPLQTFDHPWQNWTADMLETSMWHVVDADYHSFNHSWWNGDDSAGTYLSCVDDVLVSPEIDLTGYPPYESAMLTFWHMRDLNDYNDYGRVQVRYYGGSSWSSWTTVGTYHSDRDWVREFIDLTPYIGHPQKVQFRFRFTSDSDTSKSGGWFIDDIRLELRNYTEDTFFEDFEHTFPPAGWSETGHYLSNDWYNWQRYQTPDFTYAAIHGYSSYNQDEWLITPVIYNLPKFSNLTFMHNLSIVSSGVWAQLFISVDGGPWQYLRSFTDTNNHDVIEDISLWDYHGHDIQLAWAFVTYSGYGNTNDWWAIEWAKVTSFGFLRACAEVELNATDLPLNSDCDVGVSGIFWRYNYSGQDYPPNGPGSHYTGYWRYGWEIPAGYWVYGWEIPGIDNTTYPDIGPYAWWIYDTVNGIHLPENCTHEFYYFAKDYVCHTSELHHERWYVDGAEPWTNITIIKGDHPEIPYTGSHDYDSHGRILPDPIICIYDYINLTAWHWGTEPCIYPYNHSNATYYRWTWWNESSQTLEYYPTSSTPGAIWGGEINVSRHKNEIENYWWMKYTVPFNFTEGCNHTLYYFSKDDLCNTEEPNEWYVGVDDMPPVTDIKFYGINFTAKENLYYIRNDTNVCLVATDYPENEDCQTGVWYINYTIWFWNTTEYEIKLLSDEIGGGFWWYPHYGIILDPITNGIIGWYEDAVDTNGDGKWTVSDYIYIEWAMGIGRTSGYYHVESIVKSGPNYLLTIRDVSENASGHWDTLVPWTEYYGDYICFGELFDECGKYEIHYYAVDYNNMTEIMHVPDIIVDCTPPISLKKYGYPVLEVQEEGGETVHVVNATTPICITAIDPRIWDSGVREIQYKFEGETKWTTLWKYNNSTYNKFCFTLKEHFGQEYLDDWYEMYNTSRPFILYHRAIDNVSHVEDYLPTKQKIYYDPLLNETPPTIEKGYLQPSIKSPTIEDLDYVTSDTPIWLHATDNQSGLVKIEVSLTGAPYPEEWWTVWVGGPVDEYNATFNVTQFEEGTSTNLIEGEIYHLFFRSHDNAGLTSEEGKQKIVIDDTPPTSDVDDIIPYNQTYGESFTVNVTAQDQLAEVGVSSVTLYYRYREDNESSWSDWIEYGTQTSGFSWAFNAPNGPGYYQFCSTATDGLGNADDAPTPSTPPEAECHVNPVAGDFNGDGYVDIQDLAKMVQYWGMTSEDPEWETYNVDQYDLYDDDEINLLDLTILASNWTG